MAAKDSFVYRYPELKKNTEIYVPSIISKYIKTLKAELYIEPFMRLGYTIQQISLKHPKLEIHAYHENPYVVSLFNALQQGFSIPDVLEGEDYTRLCNNPNIYPPEFVAATSICYSWGGRWFSGWARDTNQDRERHDRKYQDRNCSYLKQFRKSYLNVKYFHEVFDVIQTEYNKKSILFYIQPPSEDSLLYYWDRSFFTRKKFIDWLYYLKDQNINFLVSDYELPSDFKCIWQERYVDNRTGKDKIQKLFTGKIL